MRSTSVALLVLTFLVSSGWAQKKHRTAATGGDAQTSRAATDQAEIRRLQEQDIAAHVGSDVTAMVALWTDDGVLLAPGHGPISGKAKLREFYQVQQDALGEAEILSYEEQWQEVRIIGEYAYQWGQIHSRTRSGQGKAENSTALNALRVLKREPDGGWRIFRAIYNEAHAGTSIGSETIPEGERR